jgi:ribosomal-protein-alanine N-acetyltransferase
MSSFSFSFATEKDHDALLAALELIRQDNSFDSFQFSWNSEKFLSELKLAETLVCKNKQNEVASFLTYRKNKFEFEIMALATVPQNRKQGLQTQLLSRLLTEAKINNLEVWLEVHEQNSSAIELYKKNKFSSVGRRAKYYQDGADALLLKWKVDLE